MVYSVGEDGLDDGGYEPPLTTGRAEWVKKSDEIRDLTRRPSPFKPDPPDPSEVELERAGPKLPEY